MTTPIIKPIIKPLTPADTQSANIIDGNLAQLKTLFPEAFKEGGVDFEVLKQLLGGQVDEREEKYGLNWHGKRRARQLALTPSTGTLRPCPGESVDWDTTQNLMIEGDNLEVLKLLQKSYAGKVKMIYIDPPYNTGKDFVYPDNFTDNIKNYLELTGQLDAEGRKLSSNTEASGRFHTDWLNMMYPRLKLARNLLREDGVIFISIDDAEMHNIRRVVDEVFGEENFAACLVWDRNRKNDAKYFSVGHEYMLVYFKNEAVLKENQIIFRGQKEGVEEVKAEFVRLVNLHGNDWPNIRQGLSDYYALITDEDERAPLKRFTKVDEKGPFRDDGNINWPGGGGPFYEVLHPTTNRPCKLPVSGWRYPNPNRFWEEVANGRIVFGVDETTVPRVRTNLFENSDQVMVSVHYSYAQNSANQFNALFEGKRVFDNPKPLDDLKKLVSYICGPDDLVLDFFAGSGTSGHAIFEQNETERAGRRFILVQLPEALDIENKDQKVAADFCDSIGKPRNIAELTKERLRRAAAKIGAARAHKDLATAQLSLENEAKTPEKPLDLGFKVFKLDTSNIRAWNPNPDELADTLMAHTEHLAAGRTEADVLYEVLLKQGLDLAVPVQRQVIAGHTVHSVGAGALLVCLARDGDEKGAMAESSVTAANAEALALGIADWHTQLAAALGQTPAELQTRVVLRDSLFGPAGDGDVAKTNLTAILRQRGLEDVRSL
jgi:adenine-specific DNA-methyltransferase